MAWKNRFESEILQLKDLLSENEIFRQVNVSDSRKPFILSCQLTVFVLSRKSFEPDKELLAVSNETF